MSKLKRKIPKKNKSKSSSLTDAVKKSSGNSRSRNNELIASEKIFADEWLIDRNGTRAFKVAFPNTKNDSIAAHSASTLRRKERVAVYIEEKLAEIAEKAEMNQEWVIKRYKLLADYYISDFFNNDGSLKPLDQIPRDALYAIGGFKQSRRMIGEGDNKTIVDKITNVDLPSKKDVLDSIAKHLGMFEKDNAQKRSSIPIQINVALAD